MENVNFPSVQCSAEDNHLSYAIGAGVFGITTLSMCCICVSFFFFTFFFTYNDTHRHSTNQQTIFLCEIESFAYSVA